MEGYNYNDGSNKFLSLIFPFKREMNVNLISSKKRPNYSGRFLKYGNNIF
jgi:hypothetical protein